MSARNPHQPLAAAIEAGQPAPLGATVTAGGINFAVHSAVAESVELCLYDGHALQRGCVRLPARTGDIWHGFVPAPLAAAGDLYAYRVHGPSACADGVHCTAHKLLIDPAARALTREPILDPTLYDGLWERELDSAPAMPRCRIVDPVFDWGDDRHPQTPWPDTVLYELHVKGFTARHPAVPEWLRGTYLGLAEPAVIEWLVALGVTAVELLPCQAFTSERFLLERGLVNYWGYNPMAWSAPALQYAVRDAVTEFRQMVKALHAAGIEVILDVVFNHTAEGNEHGPTLSMRGLDNGAYYLLDPAQPRRYENYTGCGNTIDAASPAVRALILDSLRWWVEAMHVDGFRFDLATVLGRNRGEFDPGAALFAALGADPTLARVKLIAEPWDVGPGGYQLGRFPVGWAEWNDRYRDTVRAYWRGDGHQLGALAERMAGSADLYDHRGRAPWASINFITSHDGFPLADLVSYNERHNEANLEGNGDGHAHNLSWNCGVEGPTDDPVIAALRRRQQANMLATLLLSQGVPMLLAGDEFGRTQCGNNNAYCQDNELSWVDWSRASVEVGLVDFVRRLLALRRRRSELRRATFFEASGQGIRWLHPEGRAMTEADWHDGHGRALGIQLRGAPGAGDLLVLMNAWSGDVPFLIPECSGAAWSCVADSAVPDEAGDGAPLCGGDVRRVTAYSLAVYEARS